MSPPKDQEFILSSLKRLDIVKHLEKLNISPCDDEYTSEYVDFLCSKSPLTKSELPKEIYSDINKIKDFYKKHQWKIDRMIRNHQVFFNAIVKVKKRAAPAPPLPTVNFTYLKSHHNFYYYICM